MVVKNGMSRYRSCLQGLQRAPGAESRATRLRALCLDMLARHESYVREHLEDLPEVRDWVWT